MAMSWGTILNGFADLARRGQVGKHQHGDAIRVLGTQLLHDVPAEGHGIRDDVLALLGPDLSVSKGSNHKVQSPA